MSLSKIIEREGTIDNYTILRLLGSGLCDVYKAKHPLTGEYVALKVLEGSDVASFKQNDFKYKMMLNERRILDDLGAHPNIVGLVGYGETKLPWKSKTSEEVGFYVPVHYNAYHYVNAISASELLKGSRLTLAQIVDVGLAIGEALIHTHGKCIVHRDIKPHNILITKDKTQVLLTDYGLAAYLEEVSQATDTPMGSPAYFSPEQAHGKPLTTKSDIYSFGSTMHRILTGTKPVDGDNALMVMYNLRNGIINPTAGVRRGVPKELEQAIDNTRKEDPDDRLDAPELVSWFRVIKQDLAA